MAIAVGPGWQTIHRPSAPRPSSWPGSCRTTCAPFDPARSCAVFNRSASDPSQVTATSHLNLTLQNCRTTAASASLFYKPTPKAPELEWVGDPQVDGGCAAVLYGPAQDKYALDFGATRRMIPSSHPPMSHSRETRRRSERAEALEAKGRLRKKTTEVWRRYQSTGLKSVAPEGCNTGVDNIDLRVCAGAVTHSW
jgi:hypothetical protein